MEIRRMLVLSTGHVSKATADALNAYAGSDIPWGPEFARDEGWMFHVRPTGDEADGTPPELVALFALARSHACSWAMLDRDGPREEALPWHAW